ncbi:MAG: putative 2-dehydropantoate 2-reductase [Anaerolineae bacterium]|nr:putative 2-dehydropantoate 2-reductase [Anaerolineae bacterium]
MNYQSYAVIGTGAIGGLYGAKLQQAGAEVHFLLHSDFDHVRAHGLRVESKDGDLRVESKDGDIDLPQVNAYYRVEDMPACEVVLVALKTTQNHLLPELLPPVVKRDSLVVLLQNGLGIEDTAAAIVGSERIFGGLCFVCSTKVGPGHICHLDYGQITLAQYTADQTAAGLTGPLQCLGTDFERAGVAVTLADDLLTARWKKLVWNVPFNGLSVVLNAKTDEMIGNQHTCTLATTLMDEVLAAAKAVHQRHIPRTFIQEMLDATKHMKPYHTSMKLDYDAGRRMEVEAIFGAPLTLARQAGLAVPQLEMIYRQLKFLDERERPNI